MGQKKKKHTLMNMVFVFRNALCPRCAFDRGRRMDVALSFGDAGWQRHPGLGHIAAQLPRRFLLSLCYCHQELPFCFRETFREQLHVGSRASGRTLACTTRRMTVAMALSEATIGEEGGGGRKALRRRRMQRRTTSCGDKNAMWRWPKPSPWSAF